MKNKKIFVAFTVLVVLVIAVAAWVFFYQNSTLVKLQKQLELGHKYLEELKYEEAIVAFNQAIEISPRSVDAYLGLADAYVGAGDYEAAATALQQGYDRTGDERLEQKLEEVNQDIAKMKEEEGRRKEEEQKNAEVEEQTEEIQMGICFDIDTLSVMDCNMWDADWLENLCAQLGCPITEQDPISTSGVGATPVETVFGEMVAGHHNNPDAAMEYEFFLTDYAGGSAGKIKTGSEFEHLNTVQLSKGEDYTLFWNFPLQPGDSYDTWHELMNVEIMRKFAEHSSSDNNEHYFYRDELNDIEYMYTEYHGDVTNSDDENAKSYFMQIEEPQKRINVDIDVNGSGVIEKINVYTSF